MPKSFLATLFSVINDLLNLLQFKDRKPGCHFPGHQSFTETPQRDEVDVRRLSDTLPGNNILDVRITIKTDSHTSRLVVARRDGQ